VAQKIYEHLYVAEYRIAAGVRERKQGRISARGKSIAGNVPRARSGERGAGWSTEDREAYALPAISRMTSGPRLSGGKKARTRLGRGA
jgi:hypothetical protein